MSHANLSRRAIVAGAASVPALALPAVAATKSVADDALARLADQICAEYDQIGGLDRDIKAADWKSFELLDKQLWETPAASIGDLAAKARVLDKRLRINGEAHSKSQKVWQLIDELLAMAVQS